MLRLMRRALLVWLLCVPPSLAADEGVSEHIPPTIRQGRIVTYAAAGMVAGSAFTAGFGGGLTVYSPPSGLVAKYRYDEHFVRRIRVGQNMALGSIFTASAAVPMFVVGPIVEGAGLRKLYPGHKTAMGWTGLGLFVAGASTTWLGFPGLIAGGTVAVVGLGLCFGQLGLNTRFARSLPERRRKELYARPRQRAQFAVAPLMSPTSRGLALVGVW